jgi:hypothetical protein
MSAGIPWHVRLRGRLISWFWPSRFRAFWVRYWESQGISESEQMRWAAEAEAEENEERRSPNGDQS